MKKKLAKLLVLVLLAALISGGTAQAAESRIIRVGLAYGDGVQAASRLKNVEGGGFQLGYYTDELVFTPLAWTDQSAVDVLITQNLYLTAKGGFTRTWQDGQGYVGCYHVHLPWTYEDFDTAQAAASQVEGAFVAWVEGAYYVRIGSYVSKADAEAAVEAMGMEEVCLGETSGYGYSVVAAGTTQILFQYDANTAGEAGAFAVVPAGETGACSFGENKYRGGFRFERIGGGSSTVVNVVDLETYIKGIIPYEMSASWPVEALKAQAVSSRTYSVNHTAGRSTHSADHFELCDTTHCHVYRGIDRANQVSDQAVEETAGELIRYNGKVIDAVYYSSNGGATEDVKNVWGSDLAYLKGKEDPYEADIADRAGNYRWSVTRSAVWVRDKLRGRGYACADIVGCTTKESDMGNVIAITFHDANGKNYTISRGDRVREFLGTNSIRFTVTGGAVVSEGYQLAGETGLTPPEGLYVLGGDGTVSLLPQESYVITAQGVRALEKAETSTGTSVGGDSFTFTGTGWGHNVGMSQWGAYAMANRGYTYRDILNFYYTGITVE